MTQRFYLTKLQAEVDGMPNFNAVFEQRIQNSVPRGESQFLEWADSQHLAPPQPETALSVRYSWVGDGTSTALQVGQSIKILAIGKCRCGSCGREVKKLFDGYCFPCLNSKAEADRCVMNPVGCHFSRGTCREPDWGLSFCYQPHVLYLSFTDKFKVGITRLGQVPTRWLDQGATLACPIALVSSRHQAGLLESLLTQVVADKSHWLKMLQSGNGVPSLEERKAVVGKCLALLSQADLPRAPAADGAELDPSLIHLLVKPVKEVQWWQFQYPGLGEGPTSDQKTKFSSTTLEKNPDISGKITGIKGQYLLLQDKCFNVRRHEGQLVDWNLS